jgi:thioredoxin reductase (NADPH)
VGTRTFKASHVILATGIIDIEPPLPNAQEAVRRGLVRQCPICDGYEMIDRKLAIIGRGAAGGRGRPCSCGHYMRRS